MAQARLCIALSVGLLAQCIAAEDPCGAAAGDSCCSCEANPIAKCKEDPSFSTYCLDYRVCAEETNTCGEPTELPEELLGSKECGNLVPQNQPCCLDHFCQPVKQVPGAEAFVVECLLGSCQVVGDTLSQSDDVCGAVGEECCGAFGACNEELQCFDDGVTATCQPYDGIGEQPELVIAPPLVPIDTPGEPVVAPEVVVVTEAECDPQAEVKAGQPCCNQACGPSRTLTCSVGRCESNLLCSEDPDCEEDDVDKNSEEAAGDIVSQSGDQSGTDEIDKDDCDWNSDYAYCADEDKMCVKGNKCVFPQDEYDDLQSQSSGCGGLLGACCSELDSPDPCAGMDLACEGGVCVLADPPACSSPGQSCCQGSGPISSTCSGEFLICEDDILSPFSDLCVECGGEGESCCERPSIDGATVEKYCVSDTMPCINGKCELYMGSCDSEGKGCCTNARAGHDYCVNEHTCDFAEENPACTRCGGGNAPCCFAPEMSMASLPVADTSLFGQMCRKPEHACNLDALDFTGTAGSCQHCGNREGAPCCWQSTAPAAFTGTRSDVLMPVCPEPGLVCQPFITIQADSHLDYYKCVPAKEGTKHQTEENDNWCGGHSQMCCPSDTLSGKCGVGYACRMSSIPGQDKCMPCGGDGEPCCFSATPEMVDPLCSSGLGCTNTIDSVLERSCSICGGDSQPCCWDALMGGYHCSDNFECTGGVGVDQQCTAVEQ